MPTVVATTASLLAAVAFYTVFILRCSFRLEGQRIFSLFDDAMISLTYARNLAEGHGLVWMAGESPVEGYTNFLWTVLMAIPHWAGLPDHLTALPVMAFGAALLVATSALAMQLARRSSRLAVTPPLAAAATAFSYPLVFWTLRGLEVGLVACLVTAACLLALRLAERPSARDRALLCLALVAALLTRTDAFVLVAVVLGFLALHPGSGRRDALVGAFATLVTLAAHTGFRVLYYGSALPNTYYLKMTGHSLLERLVRGVPALWDLVSSTLWAPAGLALALLLVRRSSLGRSEQLLVGIVAAALAYSAYVGGDFWEYTDFANRFVSVALPALFVLALLGSEALLEARGRDAWLGLAALAAAVAAFASSRVGTLQDGIGAVEPRLALAALAALLLASWRVARARTAAATGVLAVGTALVMIFFANARAIEGWVVRGGLHVRDDEVMVRTALAIRASTPRDARIGVIWAGAIPYFSRRPAVDLFGKNDPVVARLAPRGPFLPGHDKWDFEYSIGRRHPDLVVLGWEIDPPERRVLERWGYEKVFHYWVRPGRGIHRESLRAPWPFEHDLR